MISINCSLHNIHLDTFTLSPSTSELAHLFTGFEGAPDRHESSSFSECARLTRGVTHEYRSKNSGKQVSRQVLFETKSEMPINSRVYKALIIPEFLSPQLLTGRRMVPIGSGIDLEQLRSDRKQAMEMCRRLNSLPWLRSNIKEFIVRPDTFLFLVGNSPSVLVDMALGDNNHGKTTLFNRKTTLKHVYEKETKIFRLIMNETTSHQGLMPDAFFKVHSEVGRVMALIKERRWQQLNQ